MFLADQQAGIPSGMLVTDQSDGGKGVGAGVIGRAGETEANPSKTPRPSGDHRRGVVVIDHVTVRGGVWAAAGRRGTPLVFDLQPGLAQCLGEVVVHRACDGHRVGGSGLRLLVVLPETAAEMLLDHRVTGCIGWSREDRRRKEILIPIMKRETSLKLTCIMASGQFIA